MFPLTFFPFGVWGVHIIHFYVLCAVVQSAVIFFGKDIFVESRSTYLWSLITYFMTAAVVGTIVFAAGAKEIWFHDGSCIPFGAPTYLFFALFHLQNLPIALIISPIWMAIRWLENAFQIGWCRRNVQKVFKV
jgi:phosphoglycerol transferase MdoB-like AlkP superfamily enzyme